MSISELSQGPVSEGGPSEPRPFNGYPCDTRRFKGGGLKLIQRKTVNGMACFHPLEK